MHPGIGGYALLLSNGSLLFSTPTNLVRPADYRLGPCDLWHGRYLVWKLLRQLLR